MAQPVLSDHKTSSEAVVLKRSRVTRLPKTPTIFSRGSMSELTAALTTLPALRREDHGSVWPARRWPLAGFGFAVAAEFAARGAGQSPIQRAEPAR